MKQATKEHPAYKFQSTQVGNLYEFSCGKCDYKWIVDRQKMVGLLADIGEALTKPGGPMENLGRIVREENERRELAAAIRGAQKHFTYSDKGNLWLCPTCSKT
ncbi:MAG: hypothetical protein ACFFBD_21060 [Candidatus Hodarchaeota archaeon]